MALEKASARVQMHIRAMCSQAARHTFRHGMYIPSTLFSSGLASFQDRTACNIMTHMCPTAQSSL